MFNNTSGASAGALAPQPNATAPNFPAPAATASNLPVSAGVHPVHGAPGVQRAINLPSRPIAIWMVSICVVLLLATYPCSLLWV